MARVYLSLGSNVAPRENLRLAVRELAGRFGPLTLSPVYRNKAVGFEGDDFLNMVVGCDTNATPETLSEAIESIHTLAGRTRGEEKFSARSLDIDILLYGRLVLPGPPLTLPRDDVLRYAFVLKPLVDIDADGRHPVTGKTFAEHWQAMQPACTTAEDLTLVDVEFDELD